MTDTSAPEVREPVVVNWDPSDPAVCIKAGPEVSEVRFVSDKRERYIPNDKLTPKRRIGPKEYARIMGQLTEREQALFREMFGDQCPKVPTTLRRASTGALASNPATVRSANIATDRTASASASAAPPRHATADAGLKVTGPDSEPVPPARAPQESVPLLTRLATFLATPRTMNDIAAEFGWQKHTASARVSGLKKVRNVVIVDGTYRVAAE